MLHSEALHIIYDALLTPLNSFSTHALRCCTCRLPPVVSHVTSIQESSGRRMDFFSLKPPHRGCRGLPADPASIFPALGPGNPTNPARATQDAPAL
ncbi:hypothetical protein A9K55_002331 [Cordyceps militaris]|uniref:Uncharacterized protein n=1 Tax=Cordyceps militaris TaxID=73501 RepID=A0A2H4S604_CORMI|nr:hypothetical protein A9K55_002331 [Cordyceps militaris]